MAYGMTEGLGLTALRGDEWLTHQGSVGRGFRDTEIRILDDDGGTSRTGEIGEIYLRSPSTTGYQYLGGAPLLARHRRRLPARPATSATSTPTATCTSSTAAST